MTKIKNYLLSTILVLAPTLLLAHPGHEHHGTGMEIVLHFLVTCMVALALGVGLFYLFGYYHRRKNPVKRQNS